MEEHRFLVNVPPAKPRPLLWWGWLICGVLIAGVVFSFVFPTEREVPQDNPGFVTSPTTAPEWDAGITQVTVDQLLSAYTNSIPKAMTMYDGYTLMVTGYLKKVEQSGSTVYAELAPTADSIEQKTVRFTMADDSLYSSLSALPLHSEVRIVGVGQVGFETGIAFENCSAVYGSYE